MDVRIQAWTINFKSTPFAHVNTVAECRRWKIRRYEMSLSIEWVEIEINWMIWRSKMFLRVKHNWSCAIRSNDHDCLWQSHNWISRFFSHIRQVLFTLFVSLILNLNKVPAINHRCRLTMFCSKLNVFMKSASSNCWCCCCLFTLYLLVERLFRRICLFTKCDCLVETLFFVSHK